MFIELTDILRCPSDHEEGVLVLLPDGVHDRQVRSGHLGCMDCGRVFPIEDGVAVFGETMVTVSPSARLTGPAMAAFLGLGGPGGYVVLVGGAGGDSAGFAEASEGVHILALNPPPGVGAARSLSVARAAGIPVKRRHLRGVVLGPGFAEDPAWLAAAVRSLLPGQRVVGEGETPAAGELEVLASADGVWVARVRTA